MICNRLNKTSAGSAGGGGGVISCSAASVGGAGGGSASSAASAGRGGGECRHSTGSAGGGGGGHISPKHSNTCFKNHRLGTIIRCYKDVDSWPDDTDVLAYKRFVPTFDFSNKLTNKNATTHGDDWHHNAARFNKNDLAYKTVRATTFALIFDAIIVTCKSVRYDL